MRTRALRTAAALVPWAVALAACGTAGAGTTAGAPAGALPVRPAPPATVTASASIPGASSTARPTGKPLSGKPLSGKVISIDPGHNGGNASHPKIINKPVPAGPFKKPCNTTGTATASGYSEHAYNWDVATRLVKILRAQGATVVVTRPNDRGVGPCVNERAAIANRAHANAAISIHGDGAAANGHGFHVILPALIKGYTGPIVGPSKKLGYDIRDAFHSGTGEPYSSYLGHNGIDVRGDLGGLNLSKVPVVLIECGNMRNRTDAAHMTSAAWRQKAAQALAAGVTRYLT